MDNLNDLVNQDDDNFAPMLDSLADMESGYQSTQAFQLPGKRKASEKEDPKKALHRQMRETLEKRKDSYVRSLRKGFKNIALELSQLAIEADDALSP